MKLSLVCLVFCIHIGLVVGLKNVDVSQYIVKREGKSTADCEAACKSETLLKCHYFYYQEKNNSCILSSTDHPAITNQVKATGLDPETIKTDKRHLLNPHNMKVLKAQINELELRVRNFQRMKLDMEKTLDKIEMNHSNGLGKKSINKFVLEMNNKMEKLVQLTYLLQSEIDSLTNRRDSSRRDVRLLRQANSKSDVEIEQIVNNIDRFYAYISSLKRDDDVNKNELSRVKDKQDQINNWLRQLKRKVASTHIELKSNPIIMKVFHSQKILADAIDGIQQKMLSYDDKQIKSDQVYDDLYGRVIGDEGERKILATGLETIKKSVKSLKDDIKKVENPQSSSNMERLRTLTTLKNEVSLLKRSNDELQKNLKITHNDLVELIKDLVNVRLEGQSNRAGITAVALAHRHTQQIYDDMKKDQGGLLNKIHVIEDVYKRILEVVHNLEVHQVKLKQDISHFDDSVQNMAHNIERKLDKKHGVSISNQASALGVALSRLTTESESGLKPAKLTPVPNEKAPQSLQHNLNGEKKATTPEKFEEKIQKALKMKQLVKNLNTSNTPTIQKLEPLDKKIEKVQNQLKTQMKATTPEFQKLVEEKTATPKKLTKEKKNKNVSPKLSSNSKLLKTGLAKRKSLMQKSGKRKLGRKRGGKRRGIKRRGEKMRGNRRRGNRRMHNRRKGLKNE